MSQFPDRHALEALVPPVAGPPGTDHLAVVARQAIVAVLSAAGQDAATAARLPAVADVSVRFLAPGEWLVMSDAQTPDMLLQTLVDQVTDTAYCIDQSQGRVVFRLSGPNARAILARGIGIDLHPSAFAVDASANVLCGHISVNLACVADDAFELVVMRSFAESLLHDLKTMGRGFGLSVAFDT